MTIDRMLRRGVFPILSERPLDESETTNQSSGKVYVIEVGAYSDRYIDAIFTTRELAEAFVADRQRGAFDRDGRKAHQEVAGWTWDTSQGVATMTLGPDAVALGNGDATPFFRDVLAETFEAFLKRHTWNEFGDVEEHDLWAVLPVVPRDEP